jgi:hypothetical protein
VFWSGRSEISSLSFSLSLDSYSFSTNVNASIESHWWIFSWEVTIQSWKDQFLSQVKWVSDSRRWCFSFSETKGFGNLKWWNNYHVLSHEKNLRCNPLQSSKISTNHEKRRILAIDQTHTTPPCLPWKEGIKLARILLSPRLWSVSVTPRRSQAKQARPVSTTSENGACLLSSCPFWNDEIKKEELIRELKHETAVAC